MEGRSRAVVDATVLPDSGDLLDSRDLPDLLDSGDEFQTCDSAADVYRKIDFGTLT